MKTVTDKELSNVQGIQMRVRSLEDKQVSSHKHFRLIKFFIIEITNLCWRVYSKLRRKTKVGVSSQNKPY